VKQQQEKRKDEDYDEMEEALEEEVRLCETIYTD